MKGILLCLATGFLLMLTSCSVTKFVPEGEHMLSKVEITTDDKSLDISTLEPYIRQKGNSRWFSLFKIPLATYSLAGRDTSKWVNRVLQRIGEEPVLFDTLQARLSCEDLQTAMQNLGYIQASVDMTTKTRGKKLKIHYQLHPGSPYTIASIAYDIQDSLVERFLEKNDFWRNGLKPGIPFTINQLDSERKRITTFLMNNGYYRFHKDFIQYTADSTLSNQQIALTLHLLKYKANSQAEETLHPNYFIRKVTWRSSNDERVHLRKKVLDFNTAIEENEPFSSANLQKTYNNFARLQAVKYTNIRFQEVPDSQLLDCNIQISTNKPSTISFQPEGTNTAGNLGAAASLTYENRNLFRGSEVLSIQLRGAFEAITGLDGYQNEDYEEYNMETKLMFPRFVAPLLSRSFRERSTATSELAVSYNLQNRPEFHRRIFSTAWRYRWSEPHHHLSYRFDLLDLNYVYMPWISATFEREYLDNENSRNAILRYNYEDLFITKIGFAIAYNDGRNALRANIETAGNMLKGLSHMFNFEENSYGQYTFFKIAYAQYAKFDFDYTRLFQLDTDNQIALHADMGIAYPYGNSNVLPFEKRYFSGGANSVRGWSVRGLGPGKFKGTDGRIDFINQTGDMKLDMNIEYRTILFWKFNGAVFVDAGNIWTIRKYEEQPEGQFRFNKFYQQLAVGYGLGLRLNFDYFIIRFDAGMKAINPAYNSQQEHYAFLHHSLRRDFTFHFAVGLPF
ncbi:MAG: BamA/TamA family outer membrane protein [Prevotella sp.]|nr:BamA/TamA family outer membrane protein [Prevotella sp.]